MFKKCFCAQRREPQNRTKGSPALKYCAMWVVIKKGSFQHVLKKWCSNIHGSSPKHKQVYSSEGLSTKEKSRNHHTL